MERQFKGIWIPAEIWNDKDLTIQEKFVLAEIDSFSGPEGCFAMNNHFAELLTLSPNRCSAIITNLEKKGKITRLNVYAKGTKKIVKRYLKTVNYYSKNTPSINGSTPSIIEYTPSINGITPSGYGNTPSGKSKGTNTKDTNTKDTNTNTYELIFGVCNNVLLSVEEHEKLKLIIRDLDALIDDLSLYMESKNKKYKSHYATLLLWNKRNGNKKPKSIVQPVYTSPAELQDSDVELIKLRKELGIKNG